MVKYILFIVLVIYIVVFFNNHIQKRKQYLKEEDSKRISREEKEEEVCEDKYEDKYEKLENKIREDITDKLMNEEKVSEVKNTTDKGFEYRQVIGQYKGLDEVNVGKCLEGTKEYYLKKGIQMNMDMVGYIMDEEIVVRFNKTREEGEVMMSGYLKEEYYISTRSMVRNVKELKESRILIDEISNAVNQKGIYEIIYTKTEIDYSDGQGDRLLKEAKELEEYWGKKGVIVKKEKIEPYGVKGFKIVFIKNNKGDDSNGVRLVDGDYGYFSDGE